jgi:hypothetical protein
MQDVKKMEGREEMVRNFVSELTPEQRLAGLTLEQRLAGLTLEQRLLTQDDDFLRALSDDYFRSLPADVQESIYKRIGRPTK